ncbi:MAG: bifunctional adenosylcobinamide kinase/adenosylcobinamide-phosphate guanylyltransferase [Clostridia bacterium]|nr:bifunctional adenosylcobinamide kinase/adenosylcobinamide-phosphate guanylyltransferase [Clostridia bacterium]
MELIIGGAYAGKLTYAAAKYGFGEGDVLDLALRDPDGSSPALRHLEAYTKRCAENGFSAEKTLEMLEPCLAAGAAVISREIGSGIVPMDETERRWRELHGQVLSALAKRAERVTRLFCGIPEVLK